MSKSGESQPRMKWETLFPTKDNGYIAQLYLKGGIQIPELYICVRVIIHMCKRK